MQVSNVFFVNFIDFIRPIFYNLLDGGCTVSKPKEETIMNYLTYEQFGAIGDGKALDFDAIIKCHEEANRTGMPVRARDGAVYYIDGRNATAPIMTDVDFGTAKFIIDDRCVEQRTSYIFSVITENKPYEITLSSLERGATSITFPHEGNAYVKIYNDNSPIFIRKGLNMNSGTPTSDCFLVDADGNITPSVDHDYPTVTRAYARSIDDKPITLRGGIFVTIANGEESFYRYYQRGILVTRANVTITGFEHYVEGEGEQGAPYHGFIRANEAVNLTVSNAKMTPRFIYWTASKIPGKPVPMGSYDLSFWSSINVACINIEQTIDILDKRYWGIYTSNFCKNLTLEGCVFSRFDAHQGVTNATIRNCRLGFQNIQLIGYGDFLIENTTVENHGKFFLFLRADYGSLFDGNITIRNCTWKTPCANDLSIIGAGNDEDHDFGYPCVMGREITIEGLTVLDADGTTTEAKDVALLAKFSRYDEVGEYPYITPKKITVSGIKTASGSCIVTRVPERFSDLTVVIK